MIQPIFMVGARGAGKTTVGSALAQRLEYEFVDTDHYLLQTSKLSVADIVAREGWEGFRRRESAALKSVCAPKFVIATGGGAILAEQNRQFMREAGIVVYLRSSAATLALRLEASPEQEQRPSLTGRPINEEMQDVLTEREALYQDAAHIVVDGSKDPTQVVEDILNAISALSL